MTEEISIVHMPPKAQEQAQNLFLNLQIAQQCFQNFVQGVIVGMGLDGDWNLDTQTWQLTKVEAPEQE